MSDCSDPSILEAYQDVRNDKTNTNWTAISYKEGSNNTWTLVGSGEGGLEELKAIFSPSFKGFAYLRVISGDELSKRPKFVFMSFCGSEIKQIQRVKLTMHRADVLKIFEHSSISLDFRNVDEIDEADIMERVRMSGGAMYNDVN